MGLSWGHVEANKATERRQKGDRNIVYNLSLFCRFFWLWMGSSRALVGALVGSGWAHGVITVYNLSLFCRFFWAWMGSSWALVGALVGSGWAHGVILELSWGHLEANKATERRQKETEIQSTFLSLFCRFFWLWMGSGWGFGWLWLGS